MGRTTSRKGKAREEPLKVTATLPLGKQLAHTDKKVRDQAIANLVAFLSRGQATTEEEDDEGRGEGSSYIALEESEMDKLWKGLFYCFWMSDKPLIQQALARDLAGLLLLIQPGGDDDSERLDAALGFLAGFWRSIVREWHGIDRLRMDKFYMLLRRYTNATFRLLARESWSEDSISRVNVILTEGKGPISWREKSVPSSIATHLGDVWLDELNDVLSRPEVTSKPPCPLIPLLQPHIDLLSHTPTPSVHTRLISTVFKPLLDALALASPSAAADGDDEDRPRKKKKEEPIYPHIIMGCTVTDGPEKASAQELRKGLLDALFQAAARDHALEVNRRKIYKLCREEGGDDDDE